MEQEILQLLQEVLPGIDFESSDRLVDDGILDSISITTVIGELSMEYGITIPYDAIVSENFNSIQAMARMVERLKN